MTIPVFDPDNFGASSPVARLGDGDAGAGAEALASFAERLAASDLASEFPEVTCRVARTVVVTGDGGIDASDGLTSVGPAILAALPVPLRVHGPGGNDPVYVRSSGADSGEPAAADRLDALTTAVRDARSRTPDAEPVIVQEVIGRLHRERFYPHASGCMLGENHYPVSYMKPEDGVAYLMLGLGGEIEHDRFALRFSPKHPDLMPDFSTPADVLRNAQRSFRALAVGIDASAETDVGAGVGAEAGAQRSAFAPESFDLKTAFEDRTLAPIGGVVSLENETVYPGVGRPGIKVVTFASLLRGHPIPVVAILRRLRELGREEPGAPPRVGFAVNLGGRSGGSHEVVVDSIAPLASMDVDIDLVPGDSRVICTSSAALGHGRIADLRDLVYVGPARFDQSRTPEIAREIREIADAITGEGRRFALIGSGRWGSTDRSLGIPVTWTDIEGAAVQVEAALEGFNIESSRGTHFFRELTVNGIGYLHVSLQTPGDAIHWDRLDAVAAEREGTFVRHLRFEEPMEVVMDGRRGMATIRLPG